MCQKFTLKQTYFFKFGGGTLLSSNISGLLVGVVHLVGRGVGKNLNFFFKGLQSNKEARGYIGMLLSSFHILPH